MGTDWFTFVAQIINFLVLVWLLKHFLYGPIINAMENREERIASRLQEAEEKMQEAEAREKEYREQVQEIQQRREEMLQNAEKQAEQRREELLEEIREEMDESEKRWHRAVQRNREIFLQQLRERVARVTIGVIRRILADLADDELERLIITRFAERLQDVDDEQWDSLVEQARSDGDELVVEASIEVPANLKERLSEAIRKNTGEGISVSYRKTDDLIAGIQIRAAGLKVAWSIDEYLEEVEKNLNEMIQQEVE